MEVTHDAIVAEGEVFQIWHKLDAGFSFLLDSTSKAEDSSGVLVGLLLFHGVENDKDVEVPLLMSFLHVLANVGFVEAAV